MCAHFIVYTGHNIIDTRCTQVLVCLDILDTGGHYIVYTGHNIMDIRCTQVLVWLDILDTTGCPYIIVYTGHNIMDTWCTQELVWLDILYIYILYWPQYNGHIVYLGTGLAGYTGYYGRQLALLKESQAGAIKRKYLDVNYTNQIFRLSERNCITL